MAVSASWITPRGRAWLEGAQAPRPLNIFPHVCNLIDERERVLSVQNERVPLSPVSLGLPAGSIARAGSEGFQAWVDAEGPVGVQDGTLALGHKRIGWDHAEPWDPRPNWDSLHGFDWQRALPALVRRLRADSPPGGLAPLVSPQGTLIGVEEAPQVVDKSMEAKTVAAAWGPVDKLLRSLPAGKRRGVREAAAELAGLGVGLTPSGDDFLVGVMHAQWALGESGPGGRWTGFLAEAAVPRTTPLSAEWLRAAAEGEAMALWHELFGALVDDDKRAVREALARLVRVGHSSGSDALAGFVLALGVL